jgi:hypothetical protein
MQETLETLRGFATDQLPSVAIPIAILVIGWLVAVLLGAVVRGGLRRTGFDDRVAAKILPKERARTFDAARWTGKLVYYVVLLLTVVAFLQALQLTAATEPIGAMLDDVFAFIPKLIGAGIILFVG